MHGRVINADEWTFASDQRPLFLSCYLDAMRKKSVDTRKLNITHDEIHSLLIPGYGDMFLRNVGRLLPD
jgi:hypothetical protein